MAQREPVAIQDGKLHYLSKDDHIISKSQLAHDAKNEQESISGTFKTTAYWFDYLTTARAIWSMDPYTASRFIWHQEGFLRDGYIDRQYGDIFPFDTPGLPAEVDQPITAKTTPQLRMHDDLTGTEVLKLTAALDYEWGRGSEAFIDLPNYMRFVNLHTTKVGAALGRQVQCISSVYFMSHFPGSTLTSNIHLVPFLEQTLRPDQAKSPGAHKWFNKDGTYWKYCLKIAGEVQQKLTNVGYYAVEPIASTTDSYEITRPTAPTVQATDNTTAKIFTQKVDNKQKTISGITPFACLYALSRAIKSKWISMTQMEDPKNMGAYKPYQTQAQTEMQIARRAAPENLEIILNPYDWAMLQENLRNTSPDGNYTASIQSIINAGTKVFTKDTVLPGFFYIQEIGTFMVVKILQQTYEQNFDFCLSKQRGAHMFLRTKINGHTCFYRGAPIHYIAPPEYMFHNYKALEANN